MSNIIGGSIIGSKIGSAKQISQTTDDITNNSQVPGTTASDALNELNLQDKELLSQLYIDLPKYAIPLYIGLGQSNDVGWGNGAGLFSDGTTAVTGNIPYDKAKIWNPINKAFEVLTHNVNSKLDRSNNALGNAGGLYYTIAKYWDDYRNGTNGKRRIPNLPEDILFFNYAYGSIPLTYLRDSSKSNYTKDLQPFAEGRGFEEFSVFFSEFVQKLKEEYKNELIVPIFISIQGEADASDAGDLTRKYYRSYLKNYLNYVKINLVTTDDIPLFGYTMTAPGKDATKSADVNNQLIGLCEETGGNYYDTSLITGTKYQSDNIHYTNSSFEQMSNDFMEKVFIDNRLKFTTVITNRQDNSTEDVDAEGAKLLYLDDSDLSYTYKLTEAVPEDQGLIQEGVDANSYFRAETDSEINELVLKLYDNSTATNPRLSKLLKPSDYKKMYDFGFYYTFRSRAISNTTDFIASFGLGMPPDNPWNSNFSVVVEDSVIFFTLTSSDQKTLKLKVNNSNSEVYTIPNVAYGNYFDLLCVGLPESNEIDIFVNGVKLATSRFGSFEVGGTNFKSKFFVNSGSVPGTSQSYIQNFGLYIYGIPSTYQIQELIKDHNYEVFIPTSHKRDAILEISHVDNMRAGASLNITNKMSSEYNIKLSIKDDKTLIDGDNTDIIIGSNQSFFIVKENDIEDPTTRWSSLKQVFETQESFSEIEYENLGFNSELLNINSNNWMPVGTQIPTFTLDRFSGFLSNVLEAKSNTNEATSGMELELDKDKALKMITNGFTLSMLIKIPKTLVSDPFINMKLKSISDDNNENNLETNLKLVLKNINDGIGIRVDGSGAVDVETKYSINLYHKLTIVVKPNMASYEIDINGELIKSGDIEGYQGNAKGAVVSLNANENSEMKIQNLDLIIYNKNYYQEDGTFQLNVATIKDSICKVITPECKQNITLKLNTKNGLPKEVRVDNKNTFSKIKWDIDTDSYFYKSNPYLINGLRPDNTSLAYDNIIGKEKVYKSIKMNNRINYFNEDKYTEVSTKSIIKLDIDDFFISKNGTKTGGFIADDLYQIDPFSKTYKIDKGFTAGTVGWDLSDIKKEYQGSDYFNLGSLVQNSINTLVRYDIYFNYHGILVSYFANFSFIVKDTNDDIIFQRNIEKARSVTASKILKLSIDLYGTIFKNNLANGNLFKFYFKTDKTANNSSLQIRSITRTVGMHIPETLF